MLLKMSFKCFLRNLNVMRPDRTTELLCLTYYMPTNRKDNDLSEV